MSSTTSTNTSIPVPSNISSGAGSVAQQSQTTNNNNNKRKHEKLDEKKLRRLEKNRLSARECRRRKREATETKLQQIKVLEAENLRLRLQLRVGQEAEQHLNSEQQAVCDNIKELLSKKASEADIYSKLEEFKNKYADYGTSRRSSIEFHLHQVEKLLMPTQTTSVVMHAIQGGSRLSTTTNMDDQKPPAVLAPVSMAPSAIAPQTPASLAVPVTNHQETPTNPIHLPATTIAAAASLPVEPQVPPPPPQGSTNNSSSQLDSKQLFEYLVNYLQVTPEQAQQLKDSRFVAHEMDGILSNSRQVVSELRQRLAQTGDDLETEFRNVRSILTPTQAAKFLVWVASNDACMHMLNELWDKVNKPSSE